jgi:O-antigen/teichoic acid export membrane protein
MSFVNLLPRGLGLATLESLLRLLLSFGVWAYLAKTTDILSFGNFQYWWALFTIGLALSKSGLETTQSARWGKEQQITLFSEVLLLRLLLLVGCSFLIYTVSCVKLGSPWTLLSFIAVIFIVETAEWAYNALGKTKELAKRKLAHLFTVLAIKLVFIWLEVPLVVWVLGFGVDQFLLVLFIGQPFALCEKPKWSNFKQIAKNTLPIWLSGLLVILYLKIDQIMIEYALGAEDVAHYSVGVKFVEFAGVIPVLLANASWTKMVKTGEFLEFRSAVRLFWILGFLLVLATMIVGPVLLNALFDSKFLGSQQVLMVSSVSILFMFLGVFNNRYLIVQGNQGAVLALTFLGLVLNVTLNAYWLPRWGIIGASWASVFSYSFVGLWGLFLLPSTRNVGLNMIRSLR